MYQTFDSTSPLFRLTHSALLTFPLVICTTLRAGLVDTTVLRPVAAMVDYGMVVVFITAAATFVLVFNVDQLLQRQYDIGMIMVPISLGPVTGIHQILDRQPVEVFVVPKLLDDIPAGHVSHSTNHFPRKRYLRPLTLIHLT